MRLGSANIKNFPDMSREKVQEDGKKMGRLTDIWGQQENNPEEDDPAIMKALGKDWGIVHGQTNVPVYYKKALFQVTGSRVHQVPMRPTLPLVARPRLMTGTSFKLDEREGVPPFAIVNCHFIAGAYNGPTEARRKRQWNIEWDHLQDFVGDYKRKGLTVFVLGDFNHPRPPKPTANFTWLVGEHLDKIGVTRTGSVEVEELGSGNIALNSDHNGQWTRVILAPQGRG